MLIISICMLTDPSREIKITTDTCEAIFECNPHEFLNLDLNVNNETKAFRKFAYVDGDGRLVLYLTRSQIDVWVQSMKQDICDTESEYNIDVSDDFSKLTVYGYKETVYVDFNAASHISHKMQMVRLLSNGDYSYEFTLRYGAANEIVWDISVHGGDLESINEIVSAHDFSSISNKSE